MYTDISSSSSSERSLLRPLWGLATAIAIVLLVRSSSTTPMARESEPLAAAAAAKATARNNAHEDFLGEYADPNHPNCRRSIVAADAHVETAWVKGTDGSPGCPPDGSGDPWTVQGTFDDAGKPASIVVDFSPKGGPSDLAGRLVDEGIEWADGNTWTRKGD
eukprot:CAMPEP_0197173812 /NCGR_PEP_ID=MMETSP1423-20130617/599_1 /TAXON_ID=476441 /ORGANISM="Pseudo-nitzschia heimii, Strain UNC1101" /LENGTH=161 /DNA_ID=CAMNT_0042622677 /DNA_START=70 /DNA_END=555 /DNA_ORIENTATION=-